MKMIITLILTLLSSILTAPPNGMATITREEPLMPYEAIWNAVCAVESSGNPLAIGDKHLSEFSYGIVQIRKVRLDDYYKRTGTRYVESDMFDPAKAKEVFIYFFDLYGPARSDEFIKSWNGRGPLTIIYLAKVKRFL